MPCCSALVPADYETEKLQFTLNIFVENGLIPLFNDAEINALQENSLMLMPRLLFIENLAQVINFATDKINFFTENKNFVTALVKNFEAWQEDYKSFKTNLEAQLENICTQESIDVEIFNAWYGDWQKLRFNIEGRVLPLIQFSLKENLGDAAISALEKLAQYKGDVDNFYLNERKNIYQKFAFQAGGDLQEKFEVESSLYKLTEKFQRA